MIFQDFEYSHSEDCNSVGDTITTVKWFILSYFVWCALFFSCFASGFIDSQDGFQYVAIARRIYYDHTFEMPTELYPDKNLHMSLAVGTGGKIYSPTGLGYSLALLPAVAIEDVFLRLAHQRPLTAFPLQNDWPVLLFASMTNAVFGALTVVFVYLLLRELEFRPKSAAVWSFVTVVCTNLFPYTKHTFAQMGFVAFLVASFYGVKRFSRDWNRWWLVLAGASYGLVVIWYNPSYAFPALPLLMYYLLLAIDFNDFKRWRLALSAGKDIVFDALAGVVGLLPFAGLYLWFNAIRFNGSSGLAGYGGSIIPPIPPLYVMLEGFWGLLLSPGKSIFVYTPLLLVLVIFWFKFDHRKYRAELISFSLLFLIYLYFIGTLLGDVDYLVWHGESSWGPRYLTPIIPFLTILVGLIVRRFSKKQVALVVVPLALAGFAVNLVGVLLPYQIRFAGLQTDAFINGRNFNVYEYGNEIPRYAPAFNQAKTLAKRIIHLPQLYNHGQYNLRFFDGWNYPFDLGWTKWREPLPTGYVSFNNNQKTPIRKMSIQFRNHQIDPTSTYSAQLSFSLNGQQLATSSTIAINEEKEAILPLDNLLKDADNQLIIHTAFVGTSSTQLKKQQVVFMQIFRINDLPQNITTLDYPYVSPISRELFGAQYHYFGNENTDSWAIWHMHSGIFEQTFDLWWLRPLHYWDLPKELFGALFGVMILGLGIYGYTSYRLLEKLEDKEQLK